LVTYKNQKPTVEKKTETGDVPRAVMMINHLGFKGYFVNSIKTIKKVTGKRTITKINIKTKQQQQQQQRG